MVNSEDWRASTKPASFSRRQFLGSALCLAGATVLGIPALVRAQPAGQKLGLGFIGVGGRGADNLKALAGENIVALCDVNANALAAAGPQFPNAKTYKDFRKLLEQKDVEAVVVSTPDHTHAVAAITAIRAGKHVYCEKPLAHSIHECRMLAQAARDHKVATQMGNAGHAADGYRDLVEWIQAGVVGPVGEVHAWTDRPLWPQGIARRADTAPIPAFLDWDLWLGPAPERPYNPCYQPGTWRGWWDFGTGALGDMGCHILDAAFWALNLGQPASVEAEGSDANPETAPKWSIVRYNFPARGALAALKLTWYDGGKLPPPPLADLVPGQKNGCLLVGEKGRIFIGIGEAPRLVPEAAMKDFKAPNRTLPRSIGHYKEWVEACKGGQPAAANFDYAGSFSEMVLLGNVALRAAKKIEWDAPNMKVTNVPEADKFIRREYRKGWTL